MAARELVCKARLSEIERQPVLLSFGLDGLSDAEWEQVLHSLDSAPLYLSEHRRRSAAEGTFDWPQPQSGLASLETYYQTVKGQAIFMPVAFPRFHDIYKAGRSAGGIIHEIPDEQGRTFAADAGAGTEKRRSFRADRHLERLGRRDEHRAVGRVRLSRPGNHTEVAARARSPFRGHAPRFTFAVLPMAAEEPFRADSAV